MWNESENQIRLVLIRHGMTKSNKEHRYLGKTDEALCQEGCARLQKAKLEGFYPKVDCLFSSPMKRCLETAQILYQDMQPTTVSEWEEMDFGAFEGKNYIELKDDEAYQAWIDSNGTLPFPNGESREEFILRCETGFRKMLEKSQLTPQTIGAIVHGGTIMALLSRFYGGEYFDYQVSNGEGYSCILRWYKKEVRIVDMKKMKFLYKAVGDKA